MGGLPTRPRSSTKKLKAKFYKLVGSYKLDRAQFFKLVRSNNASVQPYEIEAIWKKLDPTGRRYVDFVGYRDNTQLIDDLLTGKKSPKDYQSIYTVVDRDGAN